MAWGAEEQTVNTGADPALEQPAAAPPKGPLDKVKTWAVGAGAVSAVVLVGGAAVYWQAIKQSKGRKKKKPSSIGRLIGVTGISLGVSAMVMSGIALGAAKEIEKKVEQSAVLRALL